MPMLEQLADKLRALKGIVLAAEKQFGRGAVMTLGDDEDPEPVSTISTGSLALDLATGVGGYPRGRVVEIYGPESSGKTTLALHAIAEAQRAGGVAAFIDAEHALDVAYARGIGVAADKLLISQPDTGEQALDITEMLVRSGAVDLVVIDSVAALTPKAELEGEMGDAHMGLQARLMSQALRKLTAAVYRAGTTLMFLNQLRQKIGVTFGSPETTTGGNALKFYASMRFDVRRIGQVKVGDEPVGGRTRVKVAKNKCEPTAQLLFIGSGRAPCAPPPSMRARPQRRAGKEIAPMTAHDLFVARGGEHSSRRRRAISIATSPAEPSTTGAASPASTHSSACADARQRRPCSSPSSRVSPARSRTAIEKARPCTHFPSAVPRGWLRTFRD
jgi:recombination protein RecA